MNRRTVRSTISPSTIIMVMIIGVLVCATVVVGILVGTGTIRLDGSKPDEDETEDWTKLELVDNTYSRPKANGRLIEVENLSFYLPYGFKTGMTTGGVWHYELDDGDGKAEVEVYVEKNGAKPEKFIKDKVENVTISNAELSLNGVTWVEASNSSTMAYATRFGEYIYAVIYTVQQDSKATNDATQSLAKTLYMKKVYR